MLIFNFNLICCVDGKADIYVYCVYTHNRMQTIKETFILSGSNCGLLGCDTLWYGEFNL
jgi:hypothetical protein